MILGDLNIDRWDRGNEARIISLSSSCELTEPLIALLQRVPPLSLPTSPKFRIQFVSHYQYSMAIIT